ncbi:hypothetical protein [Mycobacterium sp. SM1]|uniref:hypothetical protein n=1 Tax=Mycobacterium sp. SM1 TaxID=2816243 RepID=UPI001F4175BB|nr:hypothetical protein [Mycobacterium sp. SM1]
MFEAARLDDEHALAGFDRGKQALNSWLVEHARRADSSGVAHVYVWTPRGESKVCAYFAICPAEVVRKDDGVPGSMAGGYSRIPGYLIARLALDRALHGQGYGEQLLLDAVGKAVAASEIGGDDSSLSMRQTRSPSRFTSITTSSPSGFVSAVWRNDTAAGPLLQVLKLPPDGRGLQRGTI